MIENVTELILSGKLDESSFNKIVETYKKIKGDDSYVSIQDIYNLSLILNKYPIDLKMTGTSYEIWEDGKPETPPFDLGPSMSKDYHLWDDSLLGKNWYHLCFNAEDDSTVNYFGNKEFVVTRVSNITEKPPLIVVFINDLSTNHFQDEQVNESLKEFCQGMNKIFHELISAVLGTVAMEMNL